MLLKHLKLREGGSYLTIWMLLPSPFCPPQCKFTKTRVTSYLWEELRVLLLTRVGSCAWLRVAAAFWNNVALRSNTAVVGLKWLFLPLPVRGCAKLKYWGQSCLGCLGWEHQATIRKHWELEWKTSCGHIFSSPYNKLAGSLFLLLLKGWVDADQVRPVITGESDCVLSCGWNYKLALWI